jgi:hypothetical protein
MIDIHLLREGRHPDCHGCAYLSLLATEGNQRLLGVERWRHLDCPLDQTPRLKVEGVGANPELDEVRDPRWVVARIERRETAKALKLETGWFVTPLTVREAKRLREGAV